MRDGWPGDLTWAAARVDDPAGGGRALTTRCLGRQAGLRLGTPRLLGSDTWSPSNSPAPWFFCLLESPPSALHPPHPSSCTPGCFALSRAPPPPSGGQLVPARGCGRGPALRASFPDPRLQEPGPPSHLPWKACRALRFLAKAEVGGYRAPMLRFWKHPPSVAAAGSHPEALRRSHPRSPEKGLRELVFTG